MLRDAYSLDELRGLLREEKYRSARAAILYAIYYSMRLPLRHTAPAGDWMNIRILRDGVQPVGF